jgi:altronate dehydratase large subunit
VKFLSLDFTGYERLDGTFGVRNYVALIPTVGCANEVIRAIADRVKGTKPLLHHQGCCQLEPDLKIISRTLIGFGRNPNVASALIVSLGCESISSESVEKEIAKTGKRTERIIIQDLGGFTNSVEKGTRLAKEMFSEAQNQKRTNAKLDKLIIGLKCGASDATSGLASNPAVGVTTDLLVKENSTVIAAETTEMMGAEHLLAKRAADPKIAKKIVEIVEQMESRAKAVGVDMRGSQPTPGNIKGGITTIEEKSLGAICKAGKSKIQSVLDYGEQPKGKGLHFMDTPGSEMHVLPGLAAGGSQIVLFTTGRGAPQGFPIMPVIKISGNQQTCQKMNEHIDIDVSGIIDGTESTKNAGKQILNSLIDVAKGNLTKAELTGYTETLEIYTRGPIV